MKGIWIWLAAGILIGLIASPKTAWVLQNHADYLFRDSQKPLWGNPGWPSEPTALLLPKNWTVDAPYRPLFQSDVSPESLAADLKVVATLDRPEVGCGILLRRYNGPKVEETFRPVLLDIARLGQRCAPDNAYFWIEESAFLAKTDPEASRTALLTASRKSDFDEYGHEESQIAVQLVEGTFGFRGNFIRLMCASGVGYPHFGRFLQALPNYDPKVETEDLTERYVPSPLEDVELRDALVRIADLLQRRSRTAIGVLVSNRVLSSALGSAPFGRDKEVWNADLRRKAKMAGPLAVATAERVITVRTIPLGIPESDLVESLFKEPRGWLGGAFLLSLLLLGAGAIGMKYLGAKVGAWFGFTQHLALLACLPFVGASAQMALLIGSMVATALGAWRVWAGTFFALGTLVLAANVEPLPVIAPLSVLFWALARSRWGREPWAVSLVVAGVAVGLSAVIKPVELIALSLYPLWLVGSGLAITALAARSHPKPISFAPIVTCVALAYAGVVAREIYADEQMGRATREFLIEADRRRGLIGLPPILNKPANMNL